MGRESGTDIASLMTDLPENAPAYSVFYAIHICETMLRKQWPQESWDRLEQHGLKFRPYEHYMYKAKNIVDFKKDGDVIEFVLSFMGLYGNDSPLPRCYHDQVAIQQLVHGAGDVPLQNFLDIFNNRLYWLYYKAWKKYRYYLQVKDEPGNKVMEQVSAFFGQGAQFRKEKLAVSRYKLMQISGVLCHRVRSKEGLLIVLREFFSSFKINIQEFVKSMVKVENRPRIGSKNGSNAARLGIHCLVGEWVADYTSRICIILGPMEFEDFLHFMPEGKSAKLLRFLLKLYLNDNLEYDIKLIVKSDGFKKIAWNDGRIKLGQSMWLGSPKEAVLEKYFPYEVYNT